MKQKTHFIAIFTLLCVAIFASRLFAQNSVVFEQNANGQFLRTDTSPSGTGIHYYVAQAPVCVTPPPGMVSWWPGDGNANDIQDGNSGTLQNGVTFTSGEVNQAFHFNGSNQFVVTTNAANLSFERTNAFSMDAWVRTSDTTHNIFIASKQTNSAPFPGYGLLISNGEAPACDASNPTAPGAGQLTGFLDGAVSNTCPPDFYIQVRGTTHLNDGQWHHVAMTYNGSSSAAGMKLYVDGAEETEVVQEDTLGTHSIANTAPFTIGSRENGAGAFNGDMDEVEVFNRALVSTEVAAIFNAGSAGKCRSCTPPPSGMVSWWPAENNANDAQDGNNGTLQNGATFTSGEVGQAFHFNGSNQFVVTTNAANLSFERTDAFSIDAWIRTSETTLNHFIVAKRQINAPFKGYAMMVDNGQLPTCVGPPGAGVLSFFVDGSDTTNCPRDHAIIVRGTRPLNDGQWHHVAGTYEGSSSASGMKLYVDGALETPVVLTDNLGTNSIANDAAFTTAAGSGNGPQPFNGDIDEVEIFNRALSQAEIAAIVNAGNAGKCRPALQLSAAASRKTHTGAGAFDINMPLTGTPGVECRTGGANGDHTLVFTFSNSLVSGSASVTGGTGSVSGSPTFAGNTMSVNLTGVTNAQTTTVTLSSVTDAFGQVSSSSSVSAGFLLGDTNGDRFVNAGDALQTRNRSGQVTNGTNVRSDVNLDGSVNSGDSIIVRSQSGTSLP
ncbi:MAG: LamG-like jellyroll fold domain-containing protein [Verrucomicrobiota bacterium]